MITVDDVNRIKAEQEALGKTGLDLSRSVRTLVHLLFQQESPFPTEEHVTDAHRIAADKARSQGELHMKDGLHFIQKAHGTKLWEQSDALCAQAGVK